MAKASSLRSPFHARADQSVLHHPGIQECSDEFQQPLVFDAFRDLAHQFVMIDPIEKFFQIKVNHPFVALRNVTAALGPRRDAPIDAVKTRSCVRKTSSSIASAEPASPLAG